MNPAGLNMKIETRSPCACGGNDQLQRSLKDSQEKYSHIERILKLREMELDILKKRNEVLEGLRVEEGSHESFR